MQAFEASDESTARPTRPTAMEVTRLLRSAVGGDSEASDAFFAVVYDELHALAGAMFVQRSGHLLQPTALVNEAWLKIDGHLARIEDRRHFFRVAARAMRQVLMNYAQAARADKRAGKRLQITTLSGLGGVDKDMVDALALESALEKLGTLNERHARVVELRFLCSLSIAETAEALDVSHTTVEHDWSMARAWLRRELKSS